MDKRRSILNVSVSIISRVFLLFIALYVRRLLIRCIGTDINGLNSLYSSIIGMLSVAELGIGSAIVYSMYKPIIEGNKKQVSALYCFYRKIYRIIGAVILCAGLLLMPLLPSLIGDYKTLNVDVYVTFFLTLVSVVLSYLYSAKTALIESYKDNYITTGIFTVARLIRFGFQIGAILIWKSYTAFLICQIMETLIILVITEVVVRQMHGDIISMRETLDQEIKSEIGRNVKAMFMHKIGTIMVNSIDSVIISVFVGVVALGKYTNYNLIAGVLAATIALFFSPLTSVVGHLCAEKDPAQSERYFYHFYFLNYILGVFFFLGYYAVVDDVVAFSFGTDQNVSMIIVFIITLNRFTQYMRKASLLFRDASGTFYNDRWKPVVEGVINLFLSLLFVQVFPKDYQVVSVIVATIITTLMICDIVEPYVVFRNVFEKSPKNFYFRSYSYIALFTVCLVIMTLIKQSCGSCLTGFVINGFLSVILSIFALALLATIDKFFRYEMRTFICMKLKLK